MNRHLDRTFGRHQPPSAKCCCLQKAWDLILYTNIYDFDLVYVQTTTAELQLELSDLKTRLELQEAGTQKASSKFEFSVGESEKLKAGFETEKNARAEEKIALTQ